MKKLGRKKVGCYSPSFRHRVIKSILEEGLTANEAARRFGLSNSVTIYRWLDKLDKEKIAPMEKDSIKAKTTGQDSEKRAKAELEALKEELRIERLRSAAYKQLIKEAEDYYKIPIEKKSGSKPSKK